MTLTPPPSPWPQRVSEQLHALGQLSEALTVRLLELEERLSDYEQQLNRLDGLSANAVGGSVAVLDLLEQTERRIGRLEGLLSREPGAVDQAEDIEGLLPPRLQVLHAQPVRRAGSEQAPDPSVPTLDDPFPVEGEQPFMDELIA